MAKADPLPRPAVRAKDGRGHRWIIIAVVVTVLAVGALFAAFLAGRSTVQQQAATIGDLSTQSTRVYSDAKALEQQLVESGQTPVVSPSPIVVRGVDGPPGADGLPGRDGLNGRDGVDGISPPCLAEPTQCRGADGAPGAPGKDGADGAAGSPGAPGRDGAPGPACPDGYVPIETAGATGADGTQYGRAITCVDPTSANP